MVSQIWYIGTIKMPIRTNNWDVRNIALFCIKSPLIFKTVFCTIFAWHNLGVLSADFQANLSWSPEGTLKLCQLKILQNTALKWIKLEFCSNCDSNSKMTAEFLVRWAEKLAPSTTHYSTRILLTFIKKQMTTEYIIQEVSSQCVALKICLLSNN